VIDVEVVVAVGSVLVGNKLFSTETSILGVKFIKKQLFWLPKLYWLWIAFKMLSTWC